MIFIILIIAFIAAIMIFLRRPQFGRVPAGNRLERLRRSPNFKEGKFQNLSVTPDLTEGATYYSVLKKFLFERNRRRLPSAILPSSKTDLLSLDPHENLLVWFGHSSYFLQLDGKKILVDPVLSGSASPVKFTTRSFKGSDIYKPADIPDIDYLFISHDHWDHLDYSTVTQLQNRVKTVICGLGVGEHLEKWGFTTEQIIEKDWNESIQLEQGFLVHTLPARHFSGRGLKRNTTLWMSYALFTPSVKIYLGGDSGYDTHFQLIGDKYGPFDLAILECGQYDKSWKYIHMMPAEVVKAAIDLKAAQLMPVHWAKFGLANHGWDDPILEVSAVARENNIPLITPRIGEKVQLTAVQSFTAWWADFD